MLKYFKPTENFVCHDPLLPVGIRSCDGHDPLLPVSIRSCDGLTHQSNSHPMEQHLLYATTSVSQSRTSVKLQFVMRI